MAELNRKSCWRFDGILRFPPAIIGAGLLIGYYAFCIVAMLTLSIFTLLIGVLIAIGARIFLSYFLVAPLVAQFRLLSFIFKSLFLPRDEELDIALKKEDAPSLYEFMEDIAHAVASPPADVIKVGMNSNASVVRKSKINGRKIFTLYLGYDLLAACSRAEIGAIIAHEMAHARFGSWGFMPWLRNGLRRMGRLALLLQQEIENSNRANSKFITASVLLAINDNVGNRVSRLVGLCSRPQELQADMMSAQICGPGITRAALRRLAVLIVTSNNLSWWDRVAQFEKGGSFSEWLGSKLIPAQEESSEIERKSLALEWKTEYDTHPPLRERIAAIPDGPDHVSNDEPAIYLLKNPDEVAASLMSEITKTIHQMQRKHTIKLRKSVRAQNPRDVSAFRLLGIFLMCLSVLMAAVFLSDGNMSFSDLFATSSVEILLFLLGFVLVYSSRLRDPKLPVPHISHWYRTLTDQKARATGPGEWLDSVTADILAEVPSNVMGKKKQIEYWEQRCREALGVCDYRAAFAAAEICFKLDKRNITARLAHSIAAGYYRRQDIVQSNFAMISHQKINSSGIFWASGWTHALTGHWDFAEARLLHASDMRPGDACVKDTLAYCQMHSGKTFEAIESERAAIAIEPNEPAHRAMLAIILIISGKLQEAQEQLKIARANMPTDRTVLLLSIRVNLLLGNMDAAEDFIGQMLQIHPGSAALADIGDAFIEVKMFERSEWYYRNAIEMDYLPDAYIGLAVVAMERKDNDAALVNITNALNLTFKPPVAASSQYAVLPAAIRILRQMREPIEDCKAWSIKLTLSDPPKGIGSVLFLVFGRDLDEAKAHASWIFNAMLPDADFDAAIQACESLPSYDPQGAVIPGVQDYHLAN